MDSVLACGIHIHSNGETIDVCISMPYHPVRPELVKLKHIFFIDDDIMSTFL